MTGPTLLRRAATARPAPALDPDQRRVVEHRGGPLLVLAGPGTGKTTTLVEAVLARVAEGLAPEQVLVLTFSRKAAIELRQRISPRLAATTRGPVAMTFHAYAYALLRRERGALRLLTGAEQDLELQRLLAGQVADGAPEWPAELRPSLGLRGFREELRDLLGRAQERGLTAAGLAVLGREHGRPAWEGAAAFLAGYEARFDLDPAGPALDQSGLVRAAVELLDDPEVLARERHARRVVLVDEVQDTDPAQLRLLQALAGDGRDLVAVGDPDQSIYGFRGADARAVLRFPELFRTASGAPAPVVALRTCRRSGPELLAASRAVASRLPHGRHAPDFRDLEPAGPPGGAQVLLATSPSAEAALVADVLRRAHLRDGVPWSDMAVLVRSTTRSLAVLRRGLSGAGVPVAVPRDEVPLVEQPLVRGLLDVVQLALQKAEPTAEQVLAVLSGPVLRVDALALRRLRRALRAADVAAGGVRPGEELLVDAVEVLPELPPAQQRPLERLHALLEAARASSPSVEDVLWAVWSTSRLERRLVDDSAAGGPRGLVADAGLDAVIALLDAAGRYVDRLPGEDALGFAADLRSQQIPGDTLSARAPEGDAVRLMTAHASKGLEWPLVVVAGVQEGVWPDLRRRGSLLGADAIAAAVEGGPAVGDARSALLAEERRLFYVAVTRARERLVVSAVAGGEGDEERPSRFLDELEVDLPARAAAPPRPLTTTGLVAELREAAAGHPSEAVRTAAARRLAGLADTVPTARPDRWWGTAGLSDAGPLVAPGEVLRVSPSKVESFDTCALRWLLLTAVGVTSEPGPKQVVGNLVHALAELGARDPDEAALIARLEQVGPELELGAPWAAEKHRAQALDGLRKFLVWQSASTRELVATERALQVDFEGAVISGRVDRLERDAEGRAVVVDLKTGSAKPRAEELPRQPQLGVYQAAVALGAFADEQLTVPGGASLLQLKGTKAALEQWQVPLDDDPVDPEWALQLVREVIVGMSGTTFSATVNDLCRTCPVKPCCPAWPEGQGVVR